MDVIWNIAKKMLATAIVLPTFNLYFPLVLYEKLSGSFQSIYSAK